MNSYRPASFYYRKVAREGSDSDLRANLLKLTKEYENLRAWVRANGFIPPRFSVPDHWVEDVRERPVTEFQKEL